MSASPPVTRPTAHEHGLGYALLGGLAVTLIAILIGGGLFAWLLLATRGPSAPQLLPADIQLYATTTPNLGGVVELEQLRRALSEGLGVPDPAALAAPVERLLGVSYRERIVTWLGSEVAVAVRGVDPAALAGPDPGAALLRNGEVLFLFGSKNDPQAQAFLVQHRAVREAAGERILTREQGAVTIYAAEGSAPSPIAAFALIDHYVIFSNSAAAVAAFADAEPGADGNLASLPAFAAFKQQLTPARVGAIYTDGSPAGEAARAALGALLRGLAEEAQAQASARSRSW